MKNCMCFIESQKNEYYYSDIMVKIEYEYDHKTIYPDKNDLYRAFELCPYEKLKVVIIGQDPYHEPGQANGLAFSVYDDIKLPPSLKNIYKELKSDINIDKKNGDLSGWAKQGVLIFNTCFTVEEHKANSHRKIGWDKVSDSVLQQINDLKQPIAFILWGAHAISKRKILNNPNHLIIESPHPSPLSAYRGFFGSKPFSKVNEFLREKGIDEIDWSK